MRRGSHAFRRFTRSHHAQRPYARRLVLEELERRLAPAVTFTQSNLVTDDPAFLASQGFAPAAHTDPSLVNPWGMALGTNSGLWISDNGAGKATTYDGTGQPIPAGSPLVVTIPGPGGTGSGTPTGVATNATSGFVISSGTQSGPSTELFATEDGTIAGWNNSVDPTHAVIAVDNSASGAVYKGLALGFNESGAFLFATNFHAGTVDVFDANFHPVAMPGFKDLRGCTHSNVQFVDLVWLQQHRHIHKRELTVQGRDAAIRVQCLAKVFHGRLACLEPALLLAQSKAQRPHQDKAKLKCATLVRPTLVVVRAGNDRSRRQQRLWRFSRG